MRDEIIQGIMKMYMFKYTQSLRHGRDVTQDQFLSGD